MTLNPKSYISLATFFLALNVSTTAQAETHRVLGSDTRATETKCVRGLVSKILNTSQVKAQLQLDTLRITLVPSSQELRVATYEVRAKSLRGKQADLIGQVSYLSAPGTDPVTGEKGVVGCSTAEEYIGSETKSFTLKRSDGEIIFSRNGKSSLKIC